MSARKLVAASVAAGALVVLVVVVVLARKKVDEAPCDEGFTRSGTRCLIHRTSAGACPSPFIDTPRGCDLPRDPIAVEIPAMKVTIGPSDWEAEGRVASLTIETSAFAIDRYEVTVGRFCASQRDAGACSAQTIGASKDDGARAAAGMTLYEARTFCEQFPGGHLPSEKEWLAAAAGTPGTDRPRRYPWGDTGAVCRRAAFGLVDGPCGHGATSPDTVGAHASGATPLGVHDLAGNVEEWVESSDSTNTDNHKAIVRGGSWKTSLATELRTWLRREEQQDALGQVSQAIGFRCAYRR